MIMDVAVSLVLVAIALGVSYRQRLELEGDLMVATVRALVQLAVLSFVVHSVFHHLGLSGLVVLVMLAVASWTSARRLSGVPRAYGRAAAAISSGAGIGLLVLFAGGVFELKPRFLVPIAGMLIGNSMTATSLAGSRLRDELTDKALEVEARLALGVPARHALRDYTRRATVTSLIPTIDATKNVGLVFIPGAFVGMILGGASPAAAAQVQLIVMFMLLGAVSIAGIVATTLVGRAFVGPGERLVLPGVSS